MWPAGTLPLCHQETVYHFSPQDLGVPWRVLQWAEPSKNDKPDFQSQSITGDVSSQMAFLPPSARAVWKLEPQGQAMCVCAWRRTQLRSQPEADPTLEALSPLRTPGPTFSSQPGVVGQRQPPPGPPPQTSLPQAQRTTNACCKVSWGRLAVQPSSLQQ